MRNTKCENTQLFLASPGQPLSLWLAAPGCWGGGPGSAAAAAAAVVRLRGVWCRRWGARAGGGGGWVKPPLSPPGRDGKTRPKKIRRSRSHAARACWGSPPSLARTKPQGRASHHPPGRARGGPATGGGLPRARHRAAAGRRFGRGRPRPLRMEERGGGGRGGPRTLAPVAGPQCGGYPSRRRGGARYGGPTVLPVRWLPVRGLRYYRHGSTGAFLVSIFLFLFFRALSFSRQFALGSGRRRRCMLRRALLRERRRHGPGNQLDPSLFGDPRGLTCSHSNIRKSGGGGVAGAETAPGRSRSSPD